MKYTDYMCYAIAVMLAEQRGFDNHADYEKEVEVIYTDLVKHKESKNAR